MEYLKRDSNNQYILQDHGTGFSSSYRNKFLDTIIGSNVVTLQYIVNQLIIDQYPNLEFKFNIEFKKSLLEQINEYTNRPRIKFNNFICSFNGSPHISRQFLTSALYKFGWFDMQYCSKNFVASRDTIDGNIKTYCDSYIDERFYRKFIINDSQSAENFYKNSYGFNYERFNHVNNIKILNDRLTGSFVHVVSETLATSYYPFVTEKFLYSIVTLGLFITYGQPNWHNHLLEYYGFKKYDKIFNYQFDLIENPVLRLVELLTMLSKFEKLTPAEWHDLYLIEKDTIEYNYDWYMSKQYLSHLEKFDG
jgi:hypothetical protein